MFTTGKERVKESNEIAIILIVTTVLVFIGIALIFINN